MNSHKKITTNHLFGGGASIQPFQHTSIDISGGRFLPDYSTTPNAISDKKGNYLYTSSSSYQTILFDLLFKTPVHKVTPHTTLYVKYGLWYLSTQKTIAHENNADDKGNSTPPQQPGSLSYQGYGVAIGPEINWQFSRRLVGHVSALAYFATPSLIGKNEVSSTVFPVMKAGAMWRAR